VTGNSGDDNLGRDLSCVLVLSLVHWCSVSYARAQSRIVTQRK
jgi:hypothetical protein